MIKLNGYKGIIVIAAMILFVGGCITVAAPEVNVNAKLHPNLAAAQGFIVQAFAKITAAQNANENDLGGHARKAKELLVSANSEIKLAAEASNNKK